MTAMNKMSPFVDAYGELSNNLMLNIAEILCLQLPEGHDRVVAAKWVKKFQICNADDYKNYLKLFISCLTKKCLVEPFDKAPDDYKTNQWQAFAKEYTLKDINDAMIKEFYREALAPSYEIEVSKDLKEYVAYQDIPMFGAHFYYAFSPSEQIDDWSNFHRLNIPKHLVQDLNTSAAKNIQDANIRRAVMVDERTRRDKHDLVSPIQLRRRNAPTQGHFKTPARTRGAIPKAATTAGRKKIKKRPEWQGPVPSPEREKTPPRRGMETISFSDKTPAKVPSHLRRLMTSKRLAAPARKKGEKARKVAPSRSPTAEALAQIKSPPRVVLPPSPRTPPRPKTPEWRKTPPKAPGAFGEGVAKYFRYRRERGAPDEVLKKLHTQLNSSAFARDGIVALSENMVNVSQQLAAVSNQTSPNIEAIDELTESTKSIGQKQMNYVVTAELINLGEIAEDIVENIEILDEETKKMRELDREFKTRVSQLKAESIDNWNKAESSKLELVQKASERCEIQGEELESAAAKIASITPETEADEQNLIELRDEMMEKAERSFEKRNRLQKIRESIDFGGELAENLDLLTGTAITDIPMPHLSTRVRAELSTIFEEAKENVSMQLQESYEDPSSPYFSKHNVTIIDNQTIFDISDGCLDIVDEAINLSSEIEDKVQESLAVCETSKEQLEKEEVLVNIQSLNESFKAMKLNLQDISQQRHQFDDEDDLDLTEAPAFSSP